MQFAEEICQIMENIWNNFVGDSIRRSDQKQALAGQKIALGSCIQMMGAFKGAVALYCSEQFIRQILVHMFKENPDTVELSQIEDTLGELANMIAGNIKSLLPEPTNISLPTVVHGKDFQMSFPHCELISQLFFEWQSNVIEVTLLERKKDQAD